VGLTRFITPLEPGVKLEDHPLTSPPVSKEEFPYLKVVGTLLYLVNCTRPDMAHAVGTLCRCSSHPGPEDVLAAKGLLRYLKGTINMGISFKSPSLIEGITGYSDADYARDFTSRKSTTGWISWSSKLRPTIAQSTTEAEYYAASAAAKEALYLRKLHRDFGMPTPLSEMLIDNQSSLALIKNGASSSSTKHIDVLHTPVHSAWRLITSLRQFQNLNFYSALVKLAWLPLLHNLWFSGSQVPPPLWELLDVWES
jgi:hypothetical protein